MQNRQNNRHENFILVITGVCGSLFFIYLGYLIAAVIEYVQNNSSDILTGMSMIFGKPFAKYFNRFTPITMILGFIAFEGIFFLIVTFGKKSEKNKSQALVNSDDIDITNKSFEKSVEQKETEPSKSVTVKNDKDTDKTEELSFSDDTVTELLNDYDLSQIKAMLALKAYIDSVDVSLLKRMFKPTMSAEEITNYIKIFYE